MSVLLLKLAGPMQSWGTSSRFTTRATDPQPSKSGVLGLLAAAQGRRRTDSIEDLLALNFGVRSDQPGRVIRDFQTARSVDGRKTMPLTHRYYLSDAAFVAAIEGESDVIDTLREAIEYPRFPLYLGKRSCPPVGPLIIGVSDENLDDALNTLPWKASAWWMKRNKHIHTMQLNIIRDARPSEKTDTFIDDAPLSFDPQHRHYGSRAVIRTVTNVDNPHANLEHTAPHNPFAMWGGA